MTPEEFQHWIGDTKVETTIESIIKVDGGYSLIWDYIKVGVEYWFYNRNPLLGPVEDNTKGKKFLCTVDEPRRRVRVASIAISTVADFNKLMDLMGIDFKLKEE